MTLYNLQIRLRQKGHLHVNGESRDPLLGTAMVGQLLRPHARVYNQCYKRMKTVGALVMGCCLWLIGIAFNVAIGEFFVMLSVMYVYVTSMYIIT